MLRGTQASFINQPHGAGLGTVFPLGHKELDSSTHRQSVEIVAQYAVAVKKDFLTIQIFQKSVILRWKELGYNAANLLFWMALLTVLLLLRQVPELATGSLKSFPNDSLKGIILDPFPGVFGYRQLMAGGHGHIQSYPKGRTVIGMGMGSLNGNVTANNVVTHVFQFAGFAADQLL